MTFPRVTQKKRKKRGVRKCLTISPGRARRQTSYDISEKKKKKKTRKKNNEEKNLLYTKRSQRIRDPGRPRSQTDWKSSNDSYPSEGRNEAGQTGLLWKMADCSKLLLTLLGRGGTRPEKKPWSDRGQRRNPRKGGTAGGRKDLGGKKTNFLP